MSWKKANLDAGAKLFQVNNFTYIKDGITYSLEVDEFQDGACTGHGEHATDKSSVIQSVSGGSIEDCLNGLIANIG
jgi:hypothetical protein